MVIVRSFDVRGGLISTKTNDFQCPDYAGSIMGAPRTSIINHYIVWLNSSMDYSICVDISKSAEKLLHNIFDGFF